MTKTKTTATLLLVLLAVLAIPAAADAKRFNVRIGIGDQQASMFDNPRFQALKVKRVRYFIPWNAMKHPHQRDAATTFVQRARRDGIKVFMHISSDTLVRKKAKLPKRKRYRRQVRRLVRHFRALGVREWGSRNEANHDSQATWKSPRRAAWEFKTVRRACRGCTVVGLDVLDQEGVERYIKRFYRALGSYKRYARVVGIHNYSDVNRKRMRGTRSIMRTVRRHGKRNTKFWLTETGGIVNFGGSFPYSERRAGKRVKYLFHVVKRMRRHIKRVYVYNWTGAPRGARFDAGLTDSDGTGRRSYRVLRRKIRQYRR